MCNRMRIRSFWYLWVVGALEFNSSFCNYIVCRKLLCEDLYLFVVSDFVFFIQTIPIGNQMVEFVGA